ncbi:hypothetical protein EYF80_057707 [Liparis tanakae]|uniref:Uncharacterized protein n=1 Tax=Liparis tanakae TaxID=230148 RepID=A0A4Z2EUU4_9TELE|nr:hypothetical protein EYF80_057707 [Liparis tanakae]
MTKTIDWLRQMDDASAKDATASQTDCSSVVAVSTPPSETEVTVVPHAMDEVLNTSGSSVQAAQLPSPDPLADCEVSQDAPSQPSAEEALQISPKQANETQIGALTQDQNKTITTILPSSKEII